MRGYGNPRLTHPENKWKSIWYLMKTRKLAILALQETHLTDERVQEINEHYNKKLHVFASHDLDNPTGKGGVAIVINRRQIVLDGPKVYSIVPGRAIMIQLTIHGKDRLNILVVYAPNVTSSNGSENANFWNSIKTFFEEHRNITKPDILLGDCNMVEAGIIDRLPAHDDPDDACEALDDLKMSLHIRDGWRTTFPNMKSFTYMQSATGAQSRIDRIYMSDVMLETAREWKIVESGIPNADHSLISVQITSEEAPWIGRGRWRIPDYVIKDKDLLEHARKKGIEAEQKLKELTTRTETANSQLIWNTFKTSLINRAKDRAKQIVPGLTRKINEHQLELERVLNDQEMSEQAKIMKSREIKNEITQLEGMRMQKLQRDNRARHHIERELPSRYMSQISKEKRPRDILYALKKPGVAENIHGVVPGSAYEKNSSKMAELAKEYHNNLQQLGIDDNRSLERNHAINDTLDEIKTAINNEQQEQLKGKFNPPEIREAVRLTKNNSAPGLDGVPYELFKTIIRQCEEDKKVGNDTFDILMLMSAAFNDIAEYGIVEGSDFSDGWMCPIYKKGDKNEIANYRPITLLNTDYKIFTKALTLRLSKGGILQTKQN
ncbi:Endonuclease/exonuclease/phosphatase [Lentinula boryana]|uniref:Endonuclease/exonuclease/phosphatase n=1 Tax=Lentinula boryana TaxID=40481 RepID=A0ABQ8QMR2_9AGAR|nr:Endonuclease/exonuclease/phosphatase [Lentinula boryana]